MEIPAWAGGVGAFLAMIAGSSLVGSCVGSWLTMRFSLHRFRQERWWDKKAEAYAKLIGHMTTLHFWWGDYLHGMSQSERQPSPEEKRERDEAGLRCREAHHSLERATIEEAYVLSPQTLEILNAFLKEFARRPNEDHFYQDIMEHWRLAKKSAEALQKEMKIDLGVR